MNRTTRARRFLGVAVILAIVSVLLVSSDPAPVGHALDPANAGPVLPAAAGPVVSGSGAEVQRSVEENRDKRDALGILLLLQMLGDGGRR
jgi:hypothetical protein